MSSRRPGLANRGRSLVVVLLAIVLMGAADSCVWQVGAVVQACNGDHSDSVLVFLEIQSNQGQNTVLPGVCISMFGLYHQDNPVQSYPYRVAPGDPAKYRAGMSALRDQEAEPLIIWDDEERAESNAAWLLDLQTRIGAIREASVGEACSGTLNAGEQLKVTIIRNASGIWACGPQELTTSAPATASP